MICEFKCRFLIADVNEEETCTWMVKVSIFFYIAITLDSENITLR